MVDNAVPGLTQGSRLLSMEGVEEAAVKLSLFTSFLSELYSSSKCLVQMVLILHLSSWLRLERELKDLSKEPQTDFVQRIAREMLEWEEVEILSRYRHLQHHNSWSKLVFAGVRPGGS